MHLKDPILIELSLCNRTRKELAAIAGIPYRTFLCRIRDFSLDTGKGMLSAPQQDEILKAFGFAVKWVSSSLQNELSHLE